MEEDLLVNMQKTVLISRISLFEGIIIGIYGNWLISTILIISFSSVIFWLQICLVLLSIASLVALLWIGIVGGKLDTSLEVILLAIGHYIPLAASLIIERRAIGDIFHLIVGALLFAVIYYTEYVRARKIKLRFKKKKMV
ncbi:MAG: hypothetical protein KGD64_03450 [Candidatus Heimdallarchaeota archaeon]|nr:hypothetical protein [Candidatus Heimdallarchaeota archaeon]